MSGIYFSNFKFLYHFGFCSLANPPDFAPVGTTLPVHLFFYLNTLKFDIPFSAHIFSFEDPPDCQ